MYDETRILERAFELARTGNFLRVEDLEKTLAAEGYARSHPQMRSPSTRKQLRRLCRMAWLKRRGLAISAFKKPGPKPRPRALDLDRPKLNQLGS